MNNKELIRRALMGEKQAQEECTAKGIVLPCPCCKNESELLTEEGAFNGETPRQLYYIRCKSCFLRSGLYTSKIAALNKWNTRPAPPIGRCGECKNFKKHKNFTHPEYMFDGECKRFKSFNSEYAFCSNFEPREESR